MMMIVVIISNSSFVIGNCAVKARTLVNDN
jgi:hypothetical protein